MNYIVEVEGKEYGPIDQDTLAKWIENGRVFHDTKVRNSLIKKWYEAGSLAALQDAFAIQEAKYEKQPGALVGLIKSVAAPAAGVQKRAENTAFKYRYLPGPAPFVLRLAAFAFDAVLMLIFALLCFGFCLVVAKSTGAPNTAFYLMFFVFVCGVLSYVAGGVGVFAQTFGMWFWGLMVSRHDEEASPVFLVRAYVFGALLLLFGLLTPLVIFINGDRRALHEMLTGTRVIRIAARTKT